MRMYYVRFWRRLISEGLKTKDDVKPLADSGFLTQDEYNAIIAL